jgi:hypothetical protein
MAFLIDAARGLVPNIAVLSRVESGDAASGS